MINSAVEIANLLYRYNEFIDSGDLPGAAALFKDAKLKLRDHDELQNDVATLAMLQRVVKIYPDGTPRTKHIVTNPIIEVDEAAGTATSRSQYIVFQATDDIPMQVIAGGRYHDSFERIDGKWRFSYRDYTLFDMQGNISGHLNI
ncbi:MAG TPA: nuclear transport factor 2 family protein [Negativicutes bacterium]|jgi:3-phenylpropionate/cinnamic acid dioxygenase small subunit